MQRKKYISFFIVLLTFQIVFGAQEYFPQYRDPFSEPWRWQEFPELNGKGCRCMVEDRNGSLWFGLTGGVQRYNGIHWDFYPFNNDSTEIPVIAICAATDGTIWVGTCDGISRFKNGEWAPFNTRFLLGDKYDFPNNRFPIIEGMDKSIWIGTHNGILRVKNGAVTLYREGDTFPDINQKPDDVVKVLNLPEFNVFSIFEEEPGKLLLGLRDGRIFQCHFYKDMTFLPGWRRIDTHTGYVRARSPLIQKDNQGKIFIVSGEIGKGINIYDGRHWSEFQLYKMYGRSDIHSDIVKLSDGTILVGISGGIFAYNENQWQKYTKPDLSLPPNRWYLYETSDNNLWIIGLGNNVWRVDLSKKRWATFQGINFQAEDKNGNKWFLAHDGAVVKSDSSMQNWIRYDTSDGLINAPVVVLVTKCGQVWAAGSHNQVAATAFLNKDSDKWVIKTYPKLSWSIDPRAVLEALDGSLWFGSCVDLIAEKGQLGGLVRHVKPSIYRNEKVEYHYFNNEFDLSAIYGIGQTTDSTIWVGANSLFYYNDKNKQWNRNLKQTGYDDSYIDCISSSPAGNLWIGTRTDGVFYFQFSTGKWTHFTTNDGLSSNTIIHIHAKSDTSVWVATDRNVCYFDGQVWTENEFFNDFKIRNTRFFIRSTKDGSLWFNTIPGRWLGRTLSGKKLDADNRDKLISVRYQPDRNPPKTIITFSQERISQPGNVILSWAAQDPWRITPDKMLSFSYHLDDNDWSPFTIEKKHIFFKVNSGYHTFQVKARDLDINVDPQPATVSFYVIPPLWKQPLFLGFLLLFISTIAFFIFHLLHRNKIIRELSEAKERLFTNISHELRTPLTLIVGSVNKMASSIETESAWQQPMILLQRNCNRLMRLVNQIMDFRKLESGHTKFEPVWGDIVKFIHDIFSSFQIMVEAKVQKFEIVCKISSLYMFFDPDKIEKIVYNLLSNACKFTPTNGSITLELETIFCENEKQIYTKGNGELTFDKCLVIKITDSGIGIPPEKIDKIFDRFYQVDDKSVSNIGGTGIGLSLTKEFVELHFGEISVKSTPGQGSVFKLVFPVITDNVHQKQKIKDAPILDQPKIVKIEQTSGNVLNKAANNNKIKILLIEDDVDMRSFIQSELVSEYQIFTAGDGKDGLKQVIKTAPDLVISDIMMPNMDGIEFCANVRENERTCHIPIVLLTARTTQTDKLEGLGTGAIDYITKPFDSEELKMRIRNIIDSRQKLWKRFQQDIYIQPKEITINSVDEQFLSRAIAIIEEHMDDTNFDPQVFGEKIGVSRAGLYNKVRVLTGMSVQEFITNIRLKRAAKLLKQSGQTVSQVSYEVGFKNPSHFARAFKKQFGELPSDYLKSS